MTQIAAIPFIPNQESGLEPLAGGSPAAINVVADAKNAVRRRPGISAYSADVSALSGAVQGLHATIDGRIFAVSGSLPGSFTISHVQDSGATTLRTETSTEGVRPTFAETDAMLVISNGRELQRVLLYDVDDEGSKWDTARLDEDAPIATHVTAVASRLLANDTRTDKTLVRYTAPNQGTQTIGGHKQWGSVVTALGTSGFLRAESRPDPVVALAESTNEVWIFGTTTVQVFVPDAGTIWASAVSNEHGLAAPWSIVKNDQVFAWLDHERRFVISDARTAQVISDPIQQTLEDIGTVTDCFGYRVRHGAIDCLVWCFPTDGRTFCYQKGFGWSQWMSFNSVSNTWTRLGVNAHCRIPVDGRNIVGMTDGNIGVMQKSATTDLGTQFPAYVVTGYQNRETDLLKFCIGVKIALRRGETTSSGEPVASIQYRDDGGDWQEPILVSLGVSADREVVIDLRGLGTYRRRQWRFNFLGSEELVLASATEEYEVLAN